jgi:Flp pilus assembly protein TadB
MEARPMDENQKSAPNEQSERQKLLFVLLVVLIVCGGNGAGILTAALIWKLTGAVGIAVLAAVIITVVAFSFAMLLVVLHGQKS